MDLIFCQIVAGEFHGMCLLVGCLPLEIPKYKLKFRERPHRAYFDFRKKCRAAKSFVCNLEIVVFGMYLRYLC